VYSDIEDACRGRESPDEVLGGFEVGWNTIGDLHVPQIGQHWKKLLFALMEDWLNRAPAVASSLWDELPLLSTK